MERVPSGNLEDLQRDLTACRDQVDRLYERIYELQAKRDALAAEVAEAHGQATRQLQLFRDFLASRRSGRVGYVLALEKCVPMLRIVADECVCVNGVVLQMVTDRTMQLRAKSTPCKRCALIHSLLEEIEAAQKGAGEDGCKG